MMPAGAAIWDVDGTLVDTAELHFRAWVELAASIGKPFSRSDFAATFGRRNPEIIPALFDAEADDRTISELGERKEQIYRAAARRDGIGLLPGVRELLEGIRGARLAASHRLQRAEGESRSDLGRDSNQPGFRRDRGGRGHHSRQAGPTSIPGCGRPAEDMPEKCVVFEDAVAGVEAAKAAGMKCVAVRFVGHHSAESLRAAGADRVAECLTEITADDVRRLIESAV